MDLGVVTDHDREAAVLVHDLEAEAIAIERGRGSNRTDRQRGDRLTASGHAGKCRAPAPLLGALSGEAFCALSHVFLQKRDSMGSETHRPGARLPVCRPSGSAASASASTVGGSEAEAQARRWGVVPVPGRSWMRQSCPGATCLMNRF